MRFQLLFIKCNLDTGQEYYSFKNTGISCGTWISQATGNSLTREFPRLKFFPPVSWEMGISREFPTHGFPLNIPALSAAQSCSNTTIRASACYSYANNPTVEFLLPVVLLVEAVASAVFSKVYKSPICSMLAICIFWIETASGNRVGETVYNCWRRNATRK